jgi:hypothetical protein
MTSLVALLGIALLAACSLAPSPTRVAPREPGPTMPEQAAGTVSEGGITLSATAEPAVVPAGQPIEVEAVLTHDRPEPLIVSGSGSGIVFFSVTRIEDGLTSGPPAMEGDCARHELPPGEPMVVPFAKSGGFSADDPDAGFLRVYLADPELTLPQGTWRIDVSTVGNLGDECTGEPLALELGLIVTVTD